jgi:hypothetical protein
MLAVVAHHHATPLNTVAATDPWQHFGNSHIVQCV